MRSVQGKYKHARTFIFDYVETQLNEPDEVDGEAEQTRLRPAAREEVNTLSIEAADEENANDEDLAVLGKECRVLTMLVVVTTKIVDRLQAEQDAVAVLIETFMAGNKGCGTHEVEGKSVRFEYERTEFLTSDEQEKDSGQMAIAFSVIYYMKPGNPGQLA